MAFNHCTMQKHAVIYKGMDANNETWLRCKRNTHPYTHTYTPPYPQDRAMSKTLDKSLLFYEDKGSS